MSGLRCLAPIAKPATRQRRGPPGTLVAAEGVAAEGVAAEEKEEEAEEKEGAADDAPAPRVLNL